MKTWLSGLFVKLWCGVVDCMDQQRALVILAVVMAVVCLAFLGVVLMRRRKS